MSKLILFGTGRGADVAFRHFMADSPHEVAGFTVEERWLDQERFKGLPVVPFETVERHFAPGEYLLFALMGFEEMNDLRASKYLAGKEKGYDFASYVSSDLHALEDVKAGQNCFIMENQSINLDVAIGNNVVMWSSNHVGDSTVVEDNVWMSSHVCIGGDCVIGANSFLGNNCTITGDMAVSPYSYIGAGTLVATNTEEGGVYVQPQAERAPMESRRFIQLVSLRCRGPAEQAPGPQGKHKDGAS